MSESHIVVLHCFSLTSAPFYSSLLIESFVGAGLALESGEVMAIGDSIEVIDG